LRRGATTGHVAVVDTVNSSTQVDDRGTERREPAQHQHQLRKCFLHVVANTGTGGSGGASGTAARPRAARHRRPAQSDRRHGNGRQSDRRHGNGRRATGGVTTTTGGTTPATGGMLAATGGTTRRLVAARRPRVAPHRRLAALPRAVTTTPSGALHRRTGGTTTTSGVAAGRRWPRPGFWRTDCTGWHCGRRRGAGASGDLQLQSRGWRSDPHRSGSSPSRWLGCWPAGRSAVPGHRRGCPWFYLFPRRVVGGRSPLRRAALSAGPRPSTRLTASSSMPPPERRPGPRSGLQEQVLATWPASRAANRVARSPYFLRVRPVTEVITTSHGARTHRLLSSAACASCCLRSRSLRCSKE